MAEEKKKKEKKEEKKKEMKKMNKRKQKIIWLVEHLPVGPMLERVTRRASSCRSYARKSNTEAISASWPPGRKRTRTWFLRTFLMITKNLTSCLANPIFLQKKYVVRICHLKDFEICRQNFQKRWREGRTLDVKMIKFWKFWNILEIIRNDRRALNASFRMVGGPQTR